ncbi:hypothetical protein C8R45DRAFT_976194 [Mycena sanguinolenta]|nr:hypothetical protein C8R45DRAFT_976194 [Mycena sanguinolenta]
MCPRSQSQITMLGLPPALAAQVAIRWAAHRAMQNSIFFMYSGPRGINSWIFIVFVSPSCFYTHSSTPRPIESVRSLPQSLLVCAYLTQHLNGALVSSLRAPSCSTG